MARDSASGPITSLTKETDGCVFIPAFDFQFDVGTWTLTRIALGNYVMRKTAAANSPNPSVCLNPYMIPQKIGPDPNVAGLAPDRTHDIRGYQVTGLALIYSIGTLALTSQAATCQQTLYANNGAAAVTNPSGALTGTLATATQANPYATTLTPTTPWIIGNNNTTTADWFELNIVAQATSAYDLYGLVVRFSYNLL